MTIFTLATLDQRTLYVGERVAAYYRENAAQQFVGRYEIRMVDQGCRDTYCLEVVHAQRGVVAWLYDGQFTRDKI